MSEQSGTTSRVHISTIEWDMMDKTKFLPLSMLSSFSVRCTLYPLTLIKTRLQIQKHGEMYKGIAGTSLCFRLFNRVNIVAETFSGNKLRINREITNFFLFLFRFCNSFISITFLPRTFNLIHLISSRSFF